MEKNKTNLYDFLISVVNMVYNLLKLEKIVCLVILYLLYRDFYLVRRIEENTDVSKLLIDTKIIEYIFKNDDILITVLGALIVALLITIVVFICYVRPIYVKEIDRLSEERKYLMHEINNGNMSPIKEHHSSKAKRK